MDDLISREAAIKALKRHAGVDGFCNMPIEYITDAIRAVPSVHPDYICLDRQSILNAGYTGTEYKFRIGGRLFAVRELAQ